ncbi:GIY-YIG nuclease family protein [Roseospira navarrensis]|uniref:GIY-YIG nuclease family protein n=1 Tax=Roseospira navarrensis TaxID=140058 RepID=UPI001FE72058|nr:GIY-YIG nuclease family protein [Roseospira navarrensis]
MPPEPGADKPLDGPAGLRALAGDWVAAGDASAIEALPTAPGAYLLVLRVPDPVAPPPRFVARARADLPPGWLVYAGSARGPGGLRARLRRHLRPDKARRWHVDWLTTAPGVRVWAGPVPGGDECALMASVLALPGATVPVPGFGSSDCPRCPAHLAALPERAGPDAPR